MNIYRECNYEVWNNNFIKITHKKGVRKDATGLYRNGEIYISIPKTYEKCPEIYAKRYIDILHDRRQHFQKYEELVMKQRGYK